MGVCAKKFALRAHNGPKLVFSGVLGEFFRGNAAGGACWASFFAETRLEGRAGRVFSRKSCWRGCVGRVFSRSSSRVILLGDLCRAAALVVGPSTGSVNPSMRSYTLWVAWWAARPGRPHRGNLRMKRPRPPAVGLGVAAGCARLHTARHVNVRRLAVARNRSGVMCGWLCLRVRTVAPPPHPGGALPQPTKRR